MASGVEFEEDKFSFGPRPGANQAPGSSSAGYGHVVSGSKDPAMVQWLMNKGIVKSPGAAQALLVFVIVLNIILSYVIIHFFL